MSEEATLVPVGLLPAPGDAVADMRATSKWTIGAASATGALLLGGAPLATVNKIHGAGHLVVAALGLSLSLAAVAWVIRQIGETLMPRMVTLATLEDPDLADLRQMIAADPTTFFGCFGRTSAELADAAFLHDTVAANTAYMLAREQDPIRARILEQTLADARDNARSAHLMQRQLLEFIHAWKVRAMARSARRHTLAAASLVLIGAMILFGSIGIQGPGKATPALPRASTSPSR